MTKSGLKQDLRRRVTHASIMRVVIMFCTKIDHEPYLMTKLNK